ncbi:MAG: hypothetical protein WCA77_00880 [Thermoplasmata archaeon]
MIQPRAALRNAPFAASVVLACLMTLVLAEMIASSEYGWVLVSHFNAYGEGGLEVGLGLGVLALAIVSAWIAAPRRDAHSSPVPDHAGSPGPLTPTFR